MAIMASVAFLTGCGQTTTEATQEETVEMTRVEDMITPTTLAVKIEGMTCPAGCAAQIEKDCGKLAGVGKSEVNFAESMGYFTFDASVLSEEDILKCITGTNGGGVYSATKVDENTETEVEGDEATTEEALHVVIDEDKANV